MAKAILELEMPQSCKKCPLKHYLDYSMDTEANERTNKEKRRERNDKKWAMRN